MAKVRDMVLFTLIPISWAAPLSSETASIACPALVLLIKRVSVVIIIMQEIMVTIVSPEIMICSSASFSAGMVTTEVNAFVFAPKIRRAIF